MSRPVARRRFQRSTTSSASRRAARSALSLLPLGLPKALKVPVHHFAWSKVGGGEASLTMLDWEVAPLAPAMFNGVAKRLVDLADAMKAPAMLFTSGVLAAEARRLGYLAQVIDHIADEDDALLALAAAVHIGAGRVKVTADVLSKAERHPLGGILDGTAGDGEDPLRTAALIGVAAGLDEGRSPRARVA
jgi:hypothetical protein